MLIASVFREHGLRKMTMLEVYHSGVEGLVDWQEGLDILSMVRLGVSKRYYLCLRVVSANSSLK